ncbi:MAG: flavoprotein [Bdellovibrionota bacterium]
MSHAPKILFQLSGSIACFKACQVLSRLVQEGAEVRVAATSGALRFVGLATLEGLSGSRVFHDAFEEGRQMDHIHLAKWADLAVLAPASASCINRLAAGIGQDAVSTLFLAWDLRRKPYLVAPAMNQEMRRHPATEASLEKLHTYGVKILPSPDGHQACGDVGPGRLAEPETILAEIRAALGGGGTQ